MKFESIKIENFRQYKGPITVNFSLDKNKNFTIIRGTNGAGKTNLLNAITWCLYGSELHKVDTSSAGGPIYNSITKNEMKPGEDFFVKVELNMLDAYDGKFIFRRSLKYSMDKNGTFIKDPFGPTFEVFYSDGINDKPLTNPSIIIEKNMPKAIEGYFFFDGEKLEEYFEENSGSSIRDSVFKLSQLNLLDSAHDELVSRKKSYARKIKKLDGDTGDVMEDIAKQEKNCKLASKRKEEASNNLIKIESKLKELREKLNEINNKDAKKLKREINELNQEKKKLENLIDKRQSQKNDYLVHSFPLVLSYSAMNYVCELGKDLEDKGFIPPEYKQSFLENILEKKICICGNDLSKDLNGYNNIFELKNNTSELTNISEEVNVALRDLKNDINSTKKFNENREQFNKDIREYKRQLSDIEDKIEEKNFEFSQIDHPLIKKYSDDIKDYDHRKETQLSIKINAERDEKDARRELKELKIKLRSINVNNEQVKLFKKYSSFCDSAIVIIEQLKKDLIENIRIKVEKSTEEQFKKLMWKDNFSKVSIDKNYDVTLEDITGERVTPSILSAGEKLVLALSFVAALNSISGFELPFIIDTPMGRLDQEMKLNISKTLPDYVEGNQVSLLVTGEEYTDAFREGIINKVGKEYRIYVNETDNGTESKICLNK